MLTACGTLDNGHAWGQDATLAPSMSRLTNAAIRAAEHPATWAPLIGATLFSIGNIDEDFSQHLADDNPVFGSKQDANDASDTLRDALVSSVLISTLVMPGGNTVNEQLVNKSKGLMTEFAAMEVTHAVTSEVKHATGRERPNSVNHSSFPSGHTSTAFAAAALTSENLKSLSLAPTTETAIRAGLYTFATGTAWARVEAEMHYATDVMVGAAVGNFFSRFIHDAFLGLNSNKQIKLDLEPRSANLQLIWPFN